MKKWNIAAVWQMYGTYDVYADTLEEAKNIAIDLPLPDDKDYLSDSFKIDDDGCHEINEEDE